MNALKALLGVLIMQLATTLQGVTTVLAILDTYTIPDTHTAWVSYLSIAYLMMLILIF